jgi:hypothetical protein
MYEWNGLVGQSPIPSPSTPAEWHGIAARADLCDQREMKIRNGDFIGAVQVYVPELFRKMSILDFKGTAVRYLLTPEIKRISDKSKD